MADVAQTPAKKAALTRKRKAAAKKAATTLKRKRAGKKAAAKRAAKVGQRPMAGTKQARQAARTRLLREVHTLAVEAIESLDRGDLAAVRAKLTTIAKRGDK